MTLLVDTSVWVEAIRTGATRLSQLTAQDVPLGYTEPVLMELLAGCRTALEIESVSALVERGPLLSFDSAADFHGAAAVFRAMRQRGATSGSFVDSMIVCVAARTNATLMTLDRQQAEMAALLGVEVAS